MVPGCRAPIRRPVRPSSMYFSASPTGARARARAGDRDRDRGPGMTADRAGEEVGRERGEGSEGVGGEGCFETALGAGS